MMLCIRIQKAANHPLVLRVVSRCLALEKLHTPLAQRDRDFHPFVTKCEFLRRRQEVRDYPELTDRSVAVLGSRAHKFASLFASSRRQRF